MSHGNVEIVERFLARVNEGDLDQAVSELTPDATLDWSESEAPDSGVYRGPNAWRDWLSSRMQGLSEMLFEPTEAIDVPPNLVVTAVRARGRGRASGMKIDARGAAVWRLDGGQISATTLYQSLADAMNAVGLKE
jgi:ketosteroid isomerase-like protein